MEQWLIIGLLLLFLLYLMSEELGLSPPEIAPPKTRRLCDYTASGAVFEDISAAIGRGIRLVEVHVFSDERDEPVVATKPFNNGSDVVEDNVAFEKVMIDIANDAFPSKEPFILSIVPHTEKSYTLNQVAHHISTTVRKHLVDMKEEIIEQPLDNLKNAIVIVSGGVAGTELDKVVNLSWDSSFLRRLSHHQATHPRDPDELAQFNVDRISIVAPELIFKNLKANPETPIAYGCQWNLFASEPPGFVQKAFLAR